MYPLIRRSFYVVLSSLAFLAYFVYVQEFAEKFASAPLVRNESDKIPSPFDVFRWINSTSISKEPSANAIKERIYILGLFELTFAGHAKSPQPSSGGNEELRAAIMAVNHVNFLNLLPRNELVLLVNDTQCDPGVAIDRLFHAIYSKNTILILLGSGCSNVTEALAHVVPYWNIIQISYGSRSPTLSDRTKFPLFFRTVAPDSSHNIAKVRFIKHHRWQAVVAFSQTENRYLLPVNHLVAELEKENVSCVSTVTFSAENYKEQLKALKKLDVRIIIGSFSLAMAPLIFCAAFDLDMYGGEYVWILERHRATTTWWNVPPPNCSLAKLRTAALGALMVADYEYDSDLFASSSSRYARHSYDAVWAIALALANSDVDSLRNFDYTQKPVSEALIDSLKRLHFKGISGPIRFRGSDRVGDSIVAQIQDKSTIVNVAFYDSVTDRLNFSCDTCRPAFWRHGLVPIAQRIVRKVPARVPTCLFYGVATLSALGIAGSAAFLYFNLKFRQMKTIKLSSPNLNNLTVLGCVLVYVSALIFGFHNVSGTQNVYPNELCSLRIYFLSAGFSMVFGSMAAKSYRVHCLFGLRISAIKHKLLQDQQLIALILIPIFVDMAILVLWINVDPLRVIVHDLLQETNVYDPKVVYQPQIEVCLCRNTAGWYVALFGYKSIILIMSVSMAWKTRHIKIAALNDSQYVGICVYSALCSTVIVTAFGFVKEYYVLSYIAQNGSILIATSVTLVLMSLPKLRSILGKVDPQLSLVESMGLKVESNTRRLALDDPRETLTRLEIQNKVFRCQSEALDKEIERLEGVLKALERKRVPSVYCLETTRASWPNWKGALVSEYQLTGSRSTSFLEKLKMKLFCSTALVDEITKNVEAFEATCSTDVIEPVL